MLFALRVLLFHVPLAIILPTEGCATRAPVGLSLVCRVDMTRKIRFTREPARAGTAYVWWSILGRSGVGRLG